MDPNLSAMIERLAIFFPCFLLALTFHEFSHALMATKFGDQTANWQGRLTLNPLAHIDMMGTIVIPLISVVTGVQLIGWAKPVPVDARNFKSYRSGMFWVAFAGPISNILLGTLAAFMFVGVTAFTQASLEYRTALIAFSRAFVEMNFVLAVFNLLPIPPLDGSQMLIALLPYNAQRAIYNFWDRSFYLIFLLMFVGAFRFVFIPVEFLMKGSVYLALRVFGLA